jgi:MFS family permease
VVLLPALIWRCSTAARPAIDLTLFGYGQIRVITAASLVYSAAFYGVLLINVIFLQTQWHYSVLRAALATTPGPFMVMIMARPSGALARRIGHRAVLAAGGACWATACLGLAFGVGRSPHWTTHWLPLALLNGLATGLTLPVQSGAAVAPLPPARFGIGSAINASFRQLGAVLGVSIAVAILGVTPLATLQTYHRIWLTLAVIGLAGGLIALIPHRLPERLAVQQTT